MVVGQDGLSDGTPIQVLATAESADAAAPPARAEAAAGRPAGPAGGRPDLSKMTPEQLERARQRMRERGMTEEQIEERIRRARERSESTAP